MYQNPLQYPDLKIFLDIVYVADGGDGGINHTSLLSVDRGMGRGRHTTRLGVIRRGRSSYIYAFCGRLTTLF